MRVVLPLNQTSVGNVHPSPPSPTFNTHATPLDCKLSCLPLLKLIFANPLLLIPQSHISSSQIKVNACTPISWLPVICTLIKYLQREHKPSFQLRFSFLVLCTAPSSHSTMICLKSIREPMQNLQCLFHLFYESNYGITINIFSEVTI